MPMSGRGDRTPNWQVWKHVPNARLYEAVALSLDIDPRKLQHDHSWMSGRRLFQEGQEFNDRLFVTDQNLRNLRLLNALGMRYYDEDPVIELRIFARWAISIGWTLPREFADLAIGANDESSRIAPDELKNGPSQDPRGHADAILKRAKGRVGRKKGSGAIDDTPQLLTMLELLATGRAASVHNAARQAAELIPRTSQSPAADIGRLRRKFAKAYGTEPPEGGTWSMLQPN
jgi:hypothetical protein